MAQMDPSLFYVSVDPDEALVLRGELDMATTKELKAKIDEVSVPGKAVVLDMAQLRFMDSSGIHCIIEAFVATGQPVVLRNAPQAIRHVLDLAALVNPSDQAWTVEGEGSDSSDGSPSSRVS